MLPHSHELTVQSRSALQSLHRHSGYRSAYCVSSATCSPARRPRFSQRTKLLAGLCSQRDQWSRQLGRALQCSRYQRHRQPGPVVAIAANSGALGAAAQDATKIPAQSAPPALSKLALRATAGSVLGLLGAAVILAGGWTFTLVTCLLVYQASQEFFGFVTSQGISAGMDPPPPAVSALTSLMCIVLTIWTHVSLGKSTAALAVSSFIVLSLQLFATEKPRFAQLASSVFGLFYCGMTPAPLMSTLDLYVEQVIMQKVTLPGGMTSGWHLLIVAAIPLNLKHSSSWPLCASMVQLKSVRMYGKQALGLIF